MQSPKKYCVILTDGTDVDNPFILTPEAQEIVQQVDTRQSKRGQARQLYDILHSRIDYEFSSEEFVGYRNSREVLEEGKGICGEMTFLYVVMARALEMKSNYVSVRKDHDNDAVRHACAAVYVPELVLVDIAYNTFDIKHQEYKVLPDILAKERYLQWRRQ